VVVDFPSPRGVGVILRCKRKERKISRVPLFLSNAAGRGGKRNSPSDDDVLSVLSVREPSGKGV